MSADGTPHAVPVEVVVDDGTAYVWCKARSVKARNVARDGRAAITAYKSNDFVLVRGPARLLDDSDPAYARVTTLFLTKYDRTEAYGNDRLIAITPGKVAARIRG